MKILFLGDVVGPSGCDAIKKFLPNIIDKNSINFVIVNGENAADQGVGITEKIANELFNSGVNVITTGNHVWDQKEVIQYISKERKLLRPENLISLSPGNGFDIFETLKGEKIGVLNLMGNIFMKKCDNAFEVAEKILNEYKIKKDMDYLIVDFHGEITSEKMAMGHFLDGKATLVVGTHTHVPTADCRILDKGTAYQTDAGMCGDYNSVIGMDKTNSLNRFLNKKNTTKHFPSLGDSSLSGVIIECIKETGLAKSIKQFIYGGVLQSRN
tara:strand:- start:598 stop:1407 length:810 start_codon:yes stop_codon:yes gene_type:complete